MRRQAWFGLHGTKGLWDKRRMTACQSGHLSYHILFPSAHMTSNTWNLPPGLYKKKGKEMKKERQKKERGGKDFVLFLLLFI